MSPFTVPVRPRYGEVDSMGVVYHAHYLVYFEVGRTEFMRARGSAYADLEARGFRLAVVDAAVRYRRPAHYDEPLSVSVWLADVRRASLLFEYELRAPDGVLLADGHTRLGCIDGRHRVAALPADVLALMRAQVAPRPAAAAPPPRDPGPGAAAAAAPRTGAAAALPRTTGGAPAAPPGAATGPAAGRRGAGRPSEGA